jgi:amino acid adenylation domain-containing protein
MSLNDLVGKVLNDRNYVNTENNIIPAGKNTKEHPLSFAQERLWFLDRLETGNPAYNIAFGIRIKGSLDTALLEASLQAVVQRHEALRTSFRTVNGRSLQVISPTVTIKLPSTDLASLSDEEREVNIKHISTEESRIGFDLNIPPLIRAKLLHLAATEHILLITLHHIIADGWSVEVLLQEIARLYQYPEGEMESLPIQYQDFVYWQQKWLSGEILERQLRYWKEQLADLPPILRLPSDRARPLIQTTRGAHLSLEISPQLTTSLKKLAQEQEVTPFMLLLAAFETFLYRYTGAEDIAIGTAIANRNQPELTKLIGFFANTLVLRANLTSNPTFTELLTRVRRVALEAFAHQDLPFDRLVEAIQPERDLSRSPLFQVMFTYQNPPQMPEIAGLELTNLEIETEAAQFDLSLSITQSLTTLTATFEYNTDLFDAETIYPMLGHLQNLLEGIIANPEARISDLPLLNEGEGIESQNQRKCLKSNYSSVLELVEARVGQNPEAIAVGFNGASWTYQELDDKANLIAARLQELGVKTEVLVGIYLERSLDAIAAVLGVLKAGGAYVPLDPIYGKGRLESIVSEGKISVWLSNSDLATHISSSTESVVCVDRLDGTGTHVKAPIVCPSQLAYLIYTSGSTGKPKGVMVTHGSLLNAYLAWEEAYSLQPGDCHLQMASFSFDVCTGDWVRTLASGGKLAICSRELLLSPKELYALMGQEKVNCAEFVPAVLMNLVSYLEKSGCALDFMRLVVAGSDTWQIQDYERVKRLCGTDTRLINSYGVSEATIDSTYFETESGRWQSDRQVPIGYPFPGTEIYILDLNLQPLPIGAVGELYIGGLGLARGYWDLPDLTAAKFIPHPYSDVAGSRLYKTGDLARYLKDGTIEFLGRADFQVKIRGFRIELEEIEAILRQHEGVKEAVVLAPDNRLVAYIIPNTQTSDPELDRSQVKQWQRVFNELYQENDPHWQEGFHIEGWNSSYTGLPMLDAEVGEWMQQTVDRILDLKPTKVLEIGCGTGLMLLRIAPHCQEYRALDRSRNALDILCQQLEAVQTQLPQVQLEEGEAGNLAGIAEVSRDAVLIVSVAQYFPNIDYLVRVLEQAVSKVADGGFIFLGDVRNLELLATFHASVQLYRSSDLVTCSELKQRVQKQVFEEKQLAVSPDFFGALQQHLPRISGVEILLQRGSTHNELNKFRYDVILHIGKNPNLDSPSVSLDWETEAFTLASLQSVLQETQPDGLVVTGIPNSRTIQDLAMLQWLEEAEDTATAGEFRSCGNLATGIDPEDIWALSRKLDYQIYITYSEKPSCFDAEFISVASGRMNSKWRSSTGKSGDWHEYANNPLQTNLATQLIPQLQDFLPTKLPEYAIPNDFIVLDRLPLTANGKIDRRALPSPESYNSRNEAYIAPKTDVEAIVAEIWQKVLKVDKVGIKDNFFDLGGHSLLVGQVHGQLQEKLQQDLSIVEMFQYPTVSTLASHLSEKKDKRYSLAAASDRAAKQKAAIDRRRQLKG